MSAAIVACKAAGVVRGVHPGSQPVPAPADSADPHKKLVRSATVSGAGCRVPHEHAARGKSRGLVAALFHAHFH
jgi:hypothetical protein